MKKALLVLVIITIHNTIFAQSLKYTPSPEMDKFVGAWVYNENGKKIEIILQKRKITLKNGAEMDVLEGYHIFMMKNKTIENTQEKSTISLTNGYSIFDNKTGENPDEVSILVADPSRKKSGLATLTFLAGHPDKIQWVLRDSREGPIYHKPGDARYDRGFTLPTTMIFTRE